MFLQEILIKIHQTLKFQKKTKLISSLSAERYYLRNLKALLQLQKSIKPNIIAFCLVTEYFYTPCSAFSGITRVNMEPQPLTNQDSKSPPALMALYKDLEIKLNFILQQHTPSYFSLHNICLRHKIGHTHQQATVVGRQFKELVTIQIHFILISIQQHYR